MTKKPSKEELQKALLHRVVLQIKEDLADEVEEPLEELLSFIPKENLIGFLPEDEWESFEDLKE